jgi:hypothetical protein
MVVRNACTVQPKAWAAGGAVTVAGSELIRIPSPRGTRPIEDAHSAGGPGWYLTLSGGGGPGPAVMRPGRALPGVLGMGGQVVMSRLFSSTAPVSRARVA